jgi:hypothetical protein
VAPRRTARQQSDRGRSRPAQTLAQTDAWDTVGSDRAGDIAGYAFIQNLPRGHYELGLDARPALRVAAAFTELALAI